MRALKWRLLLAVGNIVLVVALSVIGLHEYESAHRQHPEYFYHGNLYYLPTAQIIAYCLNAPAYVAANTVSDLGIRYVDAESVWFTAHSFFFVYDGFYVAVGVLWWCVGWRIDRGKNLPISPGRVASVVDAFGAILSVALAYQGFVFRRGDLIVRAIPISTMVWGVALFSYFLAALLKRSPHSSRRQVVGER